MGSGKEADVFSARHGVVKLYRTGATKGAAFREAAHLAIAEARGLPVPKALGVGDVEGRWGLAMTLAPGESFGNAIDRRPERADDYLAEMARLHLLIHSQSSSHLGRLDARLRRNLAASPLEEEHRRDLLQRLAELPVGERICHCDFHPWNVIGSIGEAVVVDWLDAASGAPAADACRSHLLMLFAAPALAAPYLAHYCAAAGIRERDVLAWLPILAAARLSEGVEQEVEQLLILSKSP